MHLMNSKLEPESHLQKDMHIERILGKSDQGSGHSSRVDGYELVGGVGDQAVVAQAGVQGHGEPLPRLAPHLEADGADCGPDEGDNAVDAVHKEGLVHRPRADMSTMFYCLNTPY